MDLGEKLRAFGAFAGGTPAVPANRLNGCQMTNGKFSRSPASCLLLLLSAALVVVVYFYGVPKNPVGFFVDEASIAYNAHTIAQSGTDEYGYTFPLYFRAFGEYKSPVYIYLLSAVFWFTGPSILV